MIKLELLLVSVGVGLLCGLTLLGRTRPEQAQDSRKGDAKEFLGPGPELRAPLSYQWYGLPGDRSRTLPKSESEKDRLY